MSIARAGSHNGDDIYQSVVILEENVKTIAKRQEEDARSVREEMRGIRGDIQSISDTFTAMRQTNWPVVISMIVGALSFLSLLVGGSWVIIKLQTDNAISHSLTEFSQQREQITNALRKDLDANGARDEVSEIDRGKLNRKAEVTDLHLASLETDNKVIETKLVEVETQMAKNYAERNIQNAGFERRLIEHQSALHDLGGLIPKMPEQPYYQPEPVAQPRQQN